MPKRRANGEGNIRKRKDGRWEGRYTAGYDANGKAITKNVLGKTQAEVKDKLRAAIEDSKKLDPVKAGSYTLEQWLKLWYSVYVEPQVRYSTREFYHNAIDHHIIPKLGSVKLEKLTMLQIQQFYNELLKSGRVQKKNHPELKEHGLSPRMVQCVHVVLNKALEHAVEEKLILANPAKKCKIPKNTRKEMNILPEALIGPYDDIISWADMYDSASTESKKMIVSCLIRRVEVYRDYRLHIDFNIDFEQFSAGLDISAIAA